MADRKPSGKRKHDDLSDELVFQVAKMMFIDGRNATAIARWVVANFKLELNWAHGQSEKAAVDRTRTRIYEILQEAMARGFCRLITPLEEEVSRNVSREYGIDPQRRCIRVVNARRDKVPGRFDVQQLVAMASAHQTYELIWDVYHKKGDGEAVHLGLGAGTTTMNVTRLLGNMASNDPSCPKLVLHSLTSSFSLDTRTAPFSFFRFFDEDIVDIEQVPLLTQPIVTSGEFDRVKKHKVVSTAYERANEIDIVITSLASAEDEHGLLNQFLQNGPANEKQRLKEMGWKGDVQFCPYSDERPIEQEDDMERAVTLFELEELFRLASTENKYVVLIAGPCNSCGWLKTQALEPLLSGEDLLMWSHLVCDIETAEALLDNRSKASPPRPTSRVLAKGPTDARRGRVWRHRPR